MSKLTITWHGHSCFTISADGYDVVLDPYAPGSVPGLGDLSLTADMVLCSHEHSDHGFTDAVRIRTGGAENPFQITKIDTFHDDASGSLNRCGHLHRKHLRLQRSDLPRHHEDVQGGQDF